MYYTVVSVPASASVVLRKFLWAGLTAFGAARWTTLESAFVRDGLIEEQDFFRDYAISSTLPGPTFVNLAVLCGMRLGGVRIALAALVLLLAPGLVAVHVVHRLEVVEVEEDDREATAEPVAAFHLLLQRLEEEIGRAHV